MRFCRLMRPGIVTSTRFRLILKLPRTEPFLAGKDAFTCQETDDPCHAIPARRSALLRIEGPIATITLNRPAAFNSIDLSIAQKLEQLGAEVERNRRHPGAGDRGRRPRLLRRRRSADHWRRGRRRHIAPVVGELLKHYHAFIETVRRMPKIVLSSVHGSAAGAGMGLAFVTDLCIAADDARFTPAYAKIGVSPDGGSTVGMVGTVGTRRALQIFLAEDSFSATAGLRMGPGRARSFPRPNSRRRHENSPSGWRKTRRPPSPAPNRWSIRPRSHRPSSNSMPRKSASSPPCRPKIFASP